MERTHFVTSLWKGSLQDYKVYTILRDNECNAWSIFFTKNDGEKWWLTSFICFFEKLQFLPWLCLSKQNRNISITQSEIQIHVRFNIFRMFCWLTVIRLLTWSVVRCVYCPHAPQLYFQKTHHISFFTPLSLKHVETATLCSIQLSAVPGNNNKINTSIHTLYYKNSV